MLSRSKLKCLKMNLSAIYTMKYNIRLQRAIYINNIQHMVAEANVLNTSVWKIMVLVSYLSIISISKMIFAVASGKPNNF